MRPAGRKALFGEAVALREESHGSGAGRNRIALISERKVLPRTKIRSFSVGHVIDIEQLVALGKIQDFLNLVVIVVAGDRRVDEIRQRENIEQNLAVGIEAAGGNDIPREMAPYYSSGRRWESTVPLVQ